MLDNKIKQPRIFYGYIIVAASIIILIMVFGTNASYGIFLPSLQSEFGWERATISGARSLAFFLMGVFSAFGGILTDKYGPRRTMVLSGVIFGIACLLVSRVNTIWQLYLFYGVFIGVGTSAGDVVTLSTVARWFTKRRGLMSGVVKAGTGIGIMVIPLLFSWLINNYDWRTAFIVLAILSALCIIVSAQFLKRDPSVMGLQPYGQQDDITNGLAISMSGLSFNQARRTWQFWTVCAIYFVVWYITETVIVHIPPHAIDIGLSTSRAAGIVSLIGGVSIAGRLIMGSISDRITSRRAIVYNLIIMFTAMVCLQFVKTSWILYIFAAIYGFAHGGFFAILSPFVAEIFGIKHHGINLGMVILVGETGGAIGPVITGRIYDITQSYQTAFIILVVICAIALGLSLILKPVKKGYFSNNSI